MADFKESPTGILDQDALTIIRNAREQSNTDLSSKREQWLDDYERTYVFNSQRNVPTNTLHKVFIPKIYETIWNMMPRLVGNNPRFVVNPRNGSVDSTKVDSLKDYIKFEWKRIQMKTRVREIAQNMAVYGTAFMLVEWDEKDQWLWNRKKMENEKVGTVGMNKACVLDIFDVYTDYRYADVQDSPFFMHVRRGVSKAELERLGFKNLDKIDDDSILDTKKRTERTTDDAANKISQKFEEQEFNDADKQPVGRSHDLYYYYGQNDDGEPIQLVSIDLKVIGRNTINPFPHRKYPVVKFNYQEIPGEAYGIGITRMLAGLQDEFMHTRNMRLDNVLKAIKGRYIIDPTVGNIDIDQFKDINTDVMVAQGGAQAVTPVQVPNVTQNSYRETEQMEVDMQTITGINNFTQDQASGFNDTATGSRILFAQSNLRIDAVLENLEIGLARAGEMIVQNNLAFQDESVINQVIGGEAVKFDLEEFDFPFDLMIDPGSTSVQLNLKEREEAAIFLGQLTPFAQAGILEVKPLIEKFLDSYQVKNPEEFFAQVQEQAEGQPQEGGAPVDEGAPDEAIINRIMEAAEGKNTELTDRDNPEEIIEGFRLMSTSPEFEQMDPQTRNNILKFAGEAQNAIQ